MNEELAHKIVPSANASDPVGWIEKDGKQADHPTHEMENVHIGDVVDVHVEVHINPCYSWYVWLAVSAIS